MEDFWRVLHERLSTGGFKIPYTGLSVAIGVVFLTILLKAYISHRNFERIHGKADYRPFFNPMGPLGMMFGLSTQWNWDQRFNIYSKPNKEIISVEPIWGQPMLYTNSIEVLRQIAGGQSMTWIKPTWSIIGPLYWGSNLFTVNGSEWKKHRRVMQPAFNTKMYEDVWNVATRIYQEMLVADKWPVKSGETISFNNFIPETLRLTLCTILSVGFGLPVEWSQPHKATEGNGISLERAIKAQGHNQILVEVMPKWYLHLPLMATREAKEGMAAMRAWFNTAVHDKKREIEEILRETNGDTEAIQRDVFTRLVLASRQHSKDHFTDSNIIGNTWLMFFAGHESTAGAIISTLCHLAAYTDEQAIVTEEIQHVLWECGGSLTFNDYDSLVKTRSAFIEGLRMFPPGNFLIRECTEDTVVKIPLVDEGGATREKIMPLPAGTTLIADMVGIQYNPRTFSNPETYKPSRWYGVTNEDGFTAFSIGPRTCVGRKFAITEAVAFLANLLRDYTIEPLLNANESLDGWKERVLMRGTVKITLSMSNAPLKFRKR